MLNREIQRARRRDDPAVMSFGDHLEELRRRLIFALLGLAPILAVSLALAMPTLGLLLRPAQEALRDVGLPDRLLVTGPFEAFNSYLRVVIILTALIGSPWMLYQAWLFVAPGLYEHERRFVHLLVPLSAVLTVCSGLFLYFVMAPVVLTFLIGFGTRIGVQATPAPIEPPPGVVFPSVPVLVSDPASPEVGDEWINRTLFQRRTCIGYDGEQPVIAGVPYLVGVAGAVMPQPKLNEYMGMLTSFALALAAAFQTPVVVLLLGWVGLIRRETMIRYRRHAIMVALVIGAIATPADPISMLFLAVPLYFLYELGLLLLVVFPARRMVADARTAEGSYTDGREGD